MAERVRGRAYLATVAEAVEQRSTYLLVEQDGTFIGKHGERLRILRKGELLAERPVHGLEHVLIVASGVSLSAEAIRLCTEQGIPISFVSRSGTPYAKLVAPGLTGTVQTRRQQLLAYDDARGVRLAQAFARGKLLNQAALLKYMAKYRQRTAPEHYEVAREAAYRLEHLATLVAETTGAHVDEIRQRLLTLEAHGALAYWDAARALVNSPVPWPNRETRGATDLVNQCLNYGYGILYAHLERAVLLAGLDPYAGFLHEDRPGKPSLVLDLIEEFRQQVVDRCVFALLNQRVALQQSDDGRLDQPTRQTLAARIAERLEAAEPYEGRRLRLRSIMQAQARRIATFVRGEAEYQAWVGRW